MEFHRISSFESKRSGDDVMVGELKFLRRSSAMYGFSLRNLWLGNSWQEYKLSMAVARTSFHKQIMHVIARELSYPSKGLISLHIWHIIINTERLFCSDLHESAGSYSFLQILVNVIIWNLIVKVNISFHFEANNSDFLEACTKR